MPIGASKVGVLGAGLVPGGTETFNAPGTFSIPPGVKKVSITGIGWNGKSGNVAGTSWEILGILGLEAWRQVRWSSWRSSYNGGGA
jgi:hypothetical protein